MSEGGTPGGPARGGRESPLVPIVRAEAGRVLSEAQLRPDPRRLAEGWERRFVIEAARAEELVRLYESLGFEACADPVRVEQMEAVCGDCRLVVRLEFRTLYTRRRA